MTQVSKARYLNPDLDLELDLVFNPFNIIGV